MKLTVSKASIWAAGVKDRTAALAEKLDALTEAGANLEFMVARRAPEMPDKGVVFLAPIKGHKQIKAATDAGFLRTDSLHSVRVEGRDTPGVCNVITRTVAELGISLRGFSANVIGNRFVAYLAVDDVDEASKVIRALKKLK